MTAENVVDLPVFMSTIITNANGFALNSVNERKGVYTIVVLFEDGDGSVFPAMSYSLL